MNSFRIFFGKVGQGLLVGSSEMLSFYRRVLDCKTYHLERKKVCSRKTGLDRKLGYKSFVFGLPFSGKKR